MVRATHVEAPALDGVRALSRPVRRGRGGRGARAERSASPSPSRSRPQPEPLAEPEPEPAESPEADEPALTPQGHRRSAVTESDEIDYRMPKPSFLEALERGAEGGHQGHRAHGRPARGDAQPLQRRGARDRHRHRPARDALRAAARSRDQDVEGRHAEGRPGLRPGRGAGAHPRADPRQAGGGRGGAQPGAQDGAPRRRLPGRSERLVAAVGLARQGHRRQGDRHRPRQAAAHPDRRHHRLRKVRLRERDALVGPAALVAERAAHGARGPEAGRAQPLRGHPAPAHAGRHEPAPGRQRARQPDQGDGGALRRDEPREDAQPHRAQPRAPAARASRRSRTSSA